MAFPTNPSTGDQYTVNGQTYEWNGSAWDTVSSIVDSGKLESRNINSSITAVPGEIITCESAGADLPTGTTAYTITLPMSADGDAVLIMDGSGNAQNRPILVDRNGTTIDDATDDLTLDVNYFDIKLTYDSGNWSLGGK